MPGPSTPCRGCEFLPECPTYPVLERLIYSRPGFQNPPPDDARMQLLVACTRAWIRTIEASDLPDQLKRQAALPALFDLLMSGLYAQTLFDSARNELRRQGFVHADDSSAWAYHPYIWMCPACVAAGRPAADCYLPDPEIKQDRRGSGPLKAYERSTLLSRPGGRLIGDYGYLGIRAILTALLPQGAHITTGGGHRGEFDFVISTEDQLILGEVKASPLVAFPLAARLRSDVEHHVWIDAMPLATAWALFIGAAPTDERFLALPAPAGTAWPLDALVEIAADPDKAKRIVTAWNRHLEGYRLFNLEDPSTRWHRFGCGNIATGETDPAKPIELRVGNTKNLPGIDRTDDIKKGAAQVMLFARLKPGCQKEAVKTVLLGNLFAETHHEHYVRPIASLRLEWPGERPVWLFDGIVALSRNIVNDPALELLFGLPNEPYLLAEEVSEEALLAAVTEDEDSTE